MKPALTPEQLGEIKALRNTLSAQEVGEMYDRGAETIRRIWRGETHRGGTKPPPRLPPKPPTPLDLEADSLLESLTKDPTP